MAKKKNQSKKHRFKYTEPTQAVAQRSETSAEPGAAVRSVGRSTAAVASSSAAGGFGRDFGYVLQDLRRITILAGSLVVLEVLLWFLFTYTNLGDSVYALFKV